MPEIAGPQSRFSTEHGSAILEFALVLALFFTFLFGILDFARAVYTYHFVSNAAREATRFASVRGSTCSGSNPPEMWNGSAWTACPGMPSLTCPALSTNVTTYVQQCVGQGIGINSSAIVVTTTWPGTSPPGAAFACDASYPSGTGNNEGCVVQVEVQYPFNFIFPFLPTTTNTTCGSKANICMSSISEMVITQ